MWQVMKNHSNDQRLLEQHGAVAPVVAICMVALIGVSALAIDIAHFYVARNELQNAADAGALAGAGVLLNADGTVNSNANTIAYNAATQNNSENSSVEILDYVSNAGDVQRGHWAFAASSANSPDDSFPQGTFLTYSGTARYDLLGKTFADLNSDPQFVNAVKVTVRRNAAPVETFLAGIFGVNSVIMERTAVAYLGLAGSAAKNEVDEPVIICIESIVDANGAYQCNIGRMINSDANNIVVANTAGWTNFDQHQSSACSGGASASTISDVISCTPGTNPQVLRYNWYLESNGGQVQSSYDTLRNCWLQACDTLQADGTPGHDGLPDVPWKLHLPVVECGDSNNVGNCNRYLGVVEVEIVWMTESGADPHMNFTPLQMAAAGDKPLWTAPNPVPTDDASRQANFDDFMEHFNLKNVQNLEPTFGKKQMYFIPTCSSDIGAGGNGGYNFSVRAKYPALVNYAQP